MTRDQAIDELSDLQLELAACEVESKLLFRENGSPGLSMPWLDGLTARLWAPGNRPGSRWKVSVGGAENAPGRFTQWRASEVARRASLAECMAWLAREGERCSR